MLKDMYLWHSPENSNSDKHHCSVHMRRGNTACHNVAEWLSEIVFCSTSYALVENII